MFSTMMAFEFRLQRRRPSTWVYAAVFFLLGLVSVVTAAYGGGLLRRFTQAGAGELLVTAPFAVHFLVVTACNIGFVATAAVFSRAALREIDCRAEGLMFSYPLRPRLFLAGRFAGAFLAAALVFAMPVVGALVGAAAGGGGTAPIGEIRPWVFLYPYLVGVVPGLLIFGMFFFAMAVRTRTMLAVHLTTTAMCAAFLVAITFLKTHTDVAAGLIDPFGQLAMQRIWSTWSIVERNTQMVPVGGLWLANRILWLALAGAVAVGTVRWFRFEHMVAPRTGRGGRADGEPVVVPEDVLPARRTTLSFGWAARLGGVWQVASVDGKAVLRNRYFVIMLLLGMVFMVTAGFRNVGLVRDTVTEPTTYLVLELTASLFMAFAYILITLMAGELVGRDRKAAFEDISGVLPVPEWVWVVGRLLALLMVVGLLLASILVAGVAIQLLHGHHDLRLDLYAQELLLFRLPYYVQVAVLALVVQVVTRRRFVGHVVFFVVLSVLDGLLVFGPEDYLLNYAGFPNYTYSEFSGHAPHRVRLWSLSAYWMWAAAGLLVISSLLWVRGRDTSLGRRLREAGRRWSRGYLAATATVLAGLAVSGGWIFYNTHVLNAFEAKGDIERRKADYERRYRPFAETPQPRVRSIVVDVDLYPDEARYTTRGAMRLENPAAGGEVRRILVQLPRLADIDTLVIEPGFVRESCDQRHRLCWFQAASALGPGQSVTLRFSGAYQRRGFQNMRGETSLLPNGTFLYAQDLVPAIGYDPFGMGELKDEGARRRLGLPVRPRMAPLTDARARQVSPVSADADWIEFEAHVSTSGAQSVVTAGECTRRWSAAGRNHFEFRAGAPMLRYFAVHSAEYTVARDRWRDIELEIYHHPRHGKNVPLMMAAMKDSLEYFVPRLGPYPHRHLRIVEFPRYNVYAEGFPGWIPISEGFLFIARPETAKVDELYRVVAHEVAHQWWGHQVIGSNVEGMFLLSEVLAQHGALKVVQGRYAPALIDDYAAAELRRYLGGRGRETSEETPLVRTNGETWYLNYAKGFLVMRTLDRYLGPERLNEALGRFAARFRFQGPPYPTSQDLMQVLREATPAELQYLLVDQLETITFHDVSVTTGTWNRTNSGAYAVDLAYRAAKVRATGSGVESPVAVDDLVQLRLWDAEDRVIYEGWHRLTGSKGHLSLTVEGRPARAALDPDRLLLSRNVKITPGVISNEKSLPE